MNDKLTAIKIRQNDGTYSNQIPVSVLAEYVEWDNNNNLVDILGNVDIQTKGNIQYQLNQLFNTRVSVSELNDYVYNNLEQTITGWLENNVEPVGSAIIVDKTFSIQGAAADAKAIKDNFYTKDEINPIITMSTGEIRWQIPQGAHNNYPYSISGNRVIINGTISAKILRIIIYGPQLLAYTSSPSYTNYHNIYFDPVPAFIPGHSVKAEIKLISGTYETPEDTRPPFLDLRDLAHETEATWTLGESNNYEQVYPFQPQMISFGVRKGTYNNAIFEINLKDTSKTDKTLTIENEAADAATVGTEFLNLKTYLLDKFAITETLTTANWIQGSISNTGVVIDSDTRCRSTVLVGYDSAAHIKIQIISGYKVSIIEYNEQSAYSANFVQRLIPYTSEEINFIPVTSHMYRVIIAKEDDSIITPEEIPENVVLISIYFNPFIEAFVEENTIL